MVWIQQQGEKKYFFFHRTFSHKPSAKGISVPESLTTGQCITPATGPVNLCVQHGFEGGKKQNFYRKSFINTYTISIEYTKTCLTLFSQSTTWNKSDVLTKSPKMSGYSSTCKINLTVVVILFWLNIMQALFGREIFFYHILQISTQEVLAKKQYILWHNNTCCSYFTGCCKYNGCIRHPQRLKEHCATFIMKILYLTL